LGETTFGITMQQCNCRGRCSVPSITTFAYFLFTQGDMQVAKTVYISIGIKFVMTFQLSALNIFVIIISQNFPYPY